MARYKANITIGIDDENVDVTELLFTIGKMDGVTWMSINAVTPIGGKS